MPFILPQKKDPIIPTVHQTETPDSRLAWQVQDQDKQDKYKTQQEKMSITPIADTISPSTYTDRLPGISYIGQSATQGAISSAATRKAQADAAALASWKQQQQDSLKAAYAGMNAVPLGSVKYNQYGGTTTTGTTTTQQQSGGGSAGWGSGGAQGTANVLRQAGFPESAISTMVAIAKAESGWDPKAVNTANSNGSRDDGLFQINTVHKGNSWYPTDPYDPQQSANAAYAIWQGAGQTYRDWSVYNSGAYKQFLQPAPPVIDPSTFTSSTGVIRQQTGVSTIRSGAIAKAQQYADSGVGYVWGGNSLLSGVDCSGMVEQVYKAMGVDLLGYRGTASDLAGIGTKSNFKDLRPGDFVCWYGSRNGIDHIAIYAGNNEIIESYSGGEPARRRALSSSELNGGAFGVRVNLPGD